MGGMKHSQQHLKNYIGDIFPFSFDNIELLIVTNCMLMIIYVYKSIQWLQIQFIYLFFCRKRKMISHHFHLQRCKLSWSPHHIFNIALHITLGIVKRIHPIYIFRFLLFLFFVNSFHCICFSTK